MLTLPSSYNSNLDESIKENYLVQIYNDLGNIGKYLSVSDTTVSSVDYSGVITNVPQIRGSIDLLKSKSTLSNVSITCANDSLDDLLLSTRTYLNRDVKIYSQLDDESSLSNCLLVFKGILRSVQHTENKVTLQISAKRPFENITIPQTESVNGNYVPIVFGDYSSHTFGTGILGTKLQTDTIRCHPVPVDHIKEGKLVALSAESDTSIVNTGYLHEIEGDLFRTTGSENLAKVGGTLLNNETQQTFKALDGTTDIFGRTAQVNLRRGFNTLCGVEDIDFGGSTSISSDKTTISVNTSVAAGINVESFKFKINEMGSVKHTPQTITLNLNFSNVAITVDNFSHYKVILDVYWGSSATAQHTSHTIANTNVQSDDLLSIPDLSEEFVHPTENNNIVSDSDNSGNLPERVDVTFEFHSTHSGPNSYSIVFDCQPEFLVSTQLDESSTNVQSTAEILNNIQTLYSGQDGHTLSGESTIIKHPIEAHRYLCETFMSTEFTSTRPTSYTNIRDYQTAHGEMHYYITKQQEIEKELEKLQHLGGFIMRYKNDGTFDYVSPSFLTTSTTVSSTSPYLLNIGTLQTSGGSGINSTDTTFGVDITHASETLTNGDIIAIASSGKYEFIKVFLTDVVISGADVAFAQCERNLIFSNINTSFAEDATIYKVMFPHNKVEDNDFTELQLSHLPLDKIVTKYKINYHKDPANVNKYLEQKTFEDSSNRTKYNLASENIKEVKNEIDVKGDLTDFYYHHYGFMTSQPRVQISCNIVNPEFYALEVGDIIRFDGANTTQNPFGLANKGYTATTSWDRLYFIVTSTTRTLGKMSISAYELF
jgi:hypothetical protein